MAGYQMPCPVCQRWCPILMSKKGRPYWACNQCGVQVFVRGDKGVSALQALVTGMNRKKVEK